MQRIGTLRIAGVPVRVYERPARDSWGDYWPQDRTITIAEGLDRHMLVSTIVHEISHAVDHLALAGTRAKPEARAQALGAAFAECWEDLCRIVSRAKVRR